MKILRKLFDYVLLLIVAIFFLFVGAYFLSRLESIDSNVDRARRDAETERTNRQYQEEYERILKDNSLKK